MEQEPQETEQFPVSVDEFLSGLPGQRVETKHAFAKLMKGEGRQTAPAWYELFELFRKKPTGVAWPAWLEHAKAAEQQVEQQAPEQPAASQKPARKAGEGDKQ